MQYRYTVESAGSWSALRRKVGAECTWWDLSGESRTLARGVTYQQTPIGILLDRLTEHPEECDCPPAELEAAIAYLRERNPNGNEGNW